MAAPLAPTGMHRGSSECHKAAPTPDLHTTIAALHCHKYEPNLGPCS